MSFECTGTLYDIFETKEISERFRKREFVVETSDNSRYPQMVLFQLTGDRCETLDDYAKGERVRLSFSLRGREWTSPKGEVKYFNSLEVFRMEHEGRAEEPPVGEEGPSLDDDDIPF